MLPLALPVDTFRYSGYPMLPVDTCRYPKLPVDTCRYLMLPVDTCRYRMVPEDTFRNPCYQWIPVGTLCYQWISFEIVRGVLSTKEEHGQNGFLLVRHDILLQYSFVFTCVVLQKSEIESKKWFPRNPYIQGTTVPCADIIDMWTAGRCG